MPIITMWAPTSADFCSASLRLSRSVCSKVDSPPSRSRAGGTLISMLNWPSSVTNSGSAIARQRLGVLQRGVAVVVDEVELDLEAGHRVVGVEPRLAQHPGEDVEAAADLLAVPGAVGTGELLCGYFFAHALDTRDESAAGRAPSGRRTPSPWRASAPTRPGGRRRRGGRPRAPPASGPGRPHGPGRPRTRRARRRPPARPRTPAPPAAWATQVRRGAPHQRLPRTPTWSRAVVRLADRPGRVADRGSPRARRAAARPRRRSATSRPIRVPADLAGPPRRPTPAPRLRQRALDRGDRGRVGTERRRQRRPGSRAGPARRAPPRPRTGGWRRRRAPRSWPGHRADRAAGTSARRRPAAPPRAPGPARPRSNRRNRRTTRRAASVVVVGVEHEARRTGHRGARPARAAGRRPRRGRARSWRQVDPRVAGVAGAEGEHHDRVGGLEAEHDPDHGEQVLGSAGGQRGGSSGGPRSCRRANRRRPTARGAGRGCGERAVAATVDGQRSGA